ncbi:MAG: DUF2757 domain-containing protein [Firmicutes bacterium HGW-Firmicutes-12]|jgi:hypothetical protein|nr:MAG: DUF2757 domain-containing protein [Firmicutes bacterium HGW-Firmicutes-12]
MRLIYICDECGRYIDEIEMGIINEDRLGFDVLTPEEREDLVHLDWNRQVGTVRAICDSCWGEGSTEKEQDGEIIH